MERGLLCVLGGVLPGVVAGHFACRVSKTLGRRVGGLLVVGVDASLFLSAECRRRSEDKWGGV